MTAARDVSGGTHADPPQPFPATARTGHGPAHAPRFSWPEAAGLVAVIALLAMPLFIGLDAWDLRNDEAIYSYSVDRVLETDEWLTPRISPSDDQFLEKPPLKIWLVAGAMRAGLVPRDERGMRGLDVALAGVAFVYVYLLGCRLAGPIAGFTACFLLFAFDSLILEHGVRGNHMESALVTSYCGGIYHFVRWMDGGDSRRRHTVMAAVWFVIGFMTKFVAALFLPLVCLAAFGIAPGARRHARRALSDWVLPAAIAIAAIAPWFVYQTLRDAGRFWGEILGIHVITRFTATLMPTHLQPWHHYVTQLWHEAGYSSIRLALVLGAVALTVRAWRGRDWLARLLILWFALPVVIISFGTSKLFYYIYPFFPPLALGGGLAAAAIVQGVAGPAGQSALDWLMRRGRSGPVAPARQRPWLAAVGFVALGVAAWTVLAGPVRLQVGDVLFRSSSATRAGVIGAIALLAGGYSRWALGTIGVLAVALVLPLELYALRVERFSTTDHPLRSIRDCALAIQANGQSPPTGVLHASGDIHHAYFYYLRRLGPWSEGSAAAGELRARLLHAGAQSPVIVSPAAYNALDPELQAPGINIADAVFILLPGPYSRCVSDGVAAGAAAIE
jgi:4-amino-4-deoxy-L-arabinose transferase-like glycosyltransferase